MFQPSPVGNRVTKTVSTETIVENNSAARQYIQLREPSTTFLFVQLLGKPQALVYDILPSTTAVFSYEIGPRKLSANEQFFVGAHTVVGLL